MRRYPHPPRGAVAVFGALAACAALLAGTPAAAQVGPDTAAADTTAADTLLVPDTTGPRLFIYLVRHAENAPYRQVRAEGDTVEVEDPGLTARGRDRARRLAGLLTQAPLDAIYTTDYARTRRTARPVAEAAGVTPVVYDPSDLGGLARELRDRVGRVLVVGHSNTTPALVRNLTGRSVAPMSGSEYDRLYVVTVDTQGRVRSSRLHY